MREPTSAGARDDADLGAEIARLNKIIEALMNRAERSTNIQGTDFSVFQATVMLEEQVHARTAELETALCDNEKISRALRDSEALYRSVITAMVEGVLFQDAGGRIIGLNPSAERILGLRRGESIGPGSGNPPWPTIREDGSPFPAESHPAMVTLRSGEAQHGVVMGICKPGGVTWISVNSQALAGAYGAAMERLPDAVVSTFHDITARQAAEEALRKSEAKFAAIFSLTPGPMALTRLSDGVVLDASRSYAEYFGFERSEMIGRSTLPGDLCLWADAEQRQQWLSRIEVDGEVVGFETPLCRKNGSTVTVLISGKLVELGGEKCVIVDIHDITEQKLQADRLNQIAHHDPLTGLPNRLLLGDRLHQAIAQNRRAGTGVAVCYLDLDGFKEVNDRLGHQAGDRLLIEAANRLQAAVRDGDTVARVGGDEFVLLLCGLVGDEECRAALDRLIHAVAMPYQIHDREQTIVSASIGVTVYPSDHADPDSLLRHADRAMYAAKQAGKNRYHLFDTPLERRIEARQATLERIEAALAAGQFVLQYQPKIDCRHGRIVGVEALIRWRHPTLGLLQPAAFLPMIEDDRLAIPVGRWVIGEALRQIGLWQRSGLDLRVSVNTFARQLIEPDFSRQLAALLAEYPDSRADRLGIEIVETAALKEMDRVHELIEDCRALGVGFALDDFGTGYSSLVYLRHLPAQEIKIDQSFVRNMLVDAEDQAIVEAVIGLGRAFRRVVVAEGAETPAHVARLLALGCDVMQGYALAPPMGAAEIARWVRGFAPDPAWSQPERGVAAAG
jgi:diguanylate cyclase (GGDEF)-like protein/PAS domain S-box-containing protein